MPHSDAIPEPARRKLLVLVLDAANPALLREWARAGKLPTLARLMATGRVADTASLEGHYLGSPWPSFYTALNAGRHGFSWLEKLKVGSYQMRPYEAGDFTRAPTLWDTLSDAGREVLVLDVPLSELSERVRGGQVIEWGSHDGLFGFQARPAELGAEVLQRVGRHPAPVACDAEHRTLAEYRAFAESLVAGTEARALLTNALLATRRWEFAIQVFSETHCAGHQLWHFHDPRHPGYSAEEMAAAGDLIESVYVAADRALGEIVAAQTPETTIAVLTLHSMSFMAGQSLLLTQLLTRMGVMTIPAADPRTGARPTGGTLVRRLKGLYYRIPERIRAPLYRARTRVRETLVDRSVRIVLDPATTRAFRLPLGPTIGGIRYNLKGREPQGTLARGPELDAFRDELTAAFLAMRHPGSEHPMVTRVLETREMFHGPWLDELPDLLVEWNLDVPLGNTAVGNGAGATAVADVPGVGRVEGINTYARTGEHRMGGLCIVNGPGIAPGEFGGVVSNLDLAPTFTRFLGVDFADTDGSPVPGLLD